MGQTAPGSSSGRKEVESSSSSYHSPLKKNMTFCPCMMDTRILRTSGPGRASWCSEFKSSIKIMHTLKNGKDKVEVFCFLLSYYVMAVGSKVRQIITVFYPLYFDYFHSKLLCSTSFNLMKKWNSKHSAHTPVIMYSTLFVISFPVMCSQFPLLQAEALKRCSFVFLTINLELY